MEFLLIRNRNEAVAEKFFALCFVSIVSTSIDEC